jgi:NADH-quinone oxidoreductase subunit E
MLHRKPMGKYHVQICTNISCLLVGGEELVGAGLPQARHRHKQVTPDGRVSLEEVECIGACSWAPAIQVNYDFYHDVTPEQLEKLIDGLAAGKRPEEITEFRRLR